MSQLGAPPLARGVRGQVLVGVLLNDGSDLSAGHAASYLGWLLRGVGAAELPVQQPTPFELVIHLSAAGALGLTLPYALRLRTAEVLE